jgi:hypothetical protein
MIDPITIATLVTVIVTGISQIIQLYFDYKLSDKQGHASIYRVYESNCCSSIKENEN